MKSPRFDLVILDWDGTVADSTGIIVDAVISAAEGAGVGKLLFLDEVLGANLGLVHAPVSYTHLTLPTICSV